MKNKIQSVLLLVLAITAPHTFATESTDNALLKGSHPGDPVKRWGAALPNNRGSLNQLPGDVDHEDACLWEVNGQSVTGHLPKRSSS